MKPNTTQVGFFRLFLAWAFVLIAFPVLSYGANLPPLPKAPVRNMSIRMTLQPGGMATVGVVIEDGARSVLVRAVGPGLKRYGVSNVLHDPMMTLFSGQAAIHDNNDWHQTGVSRSVTEDNTKVRYVYKLEELRALTAAAGAFSFPEYDPDRPEDSFDAAVAVELAPGAYTLQVKNFFRPALGEVDQGGEVLIELYYLF